MTGTSAGAVDTVIVGAGPHALTVTAELVADGLLDPEDLVVVDPSGCWLERWERQFAQLAIRYLRSPVVHHPAPEVDAILRRNDLVPDDVTTGAVPLPSHRIVMAVARDLVDELGLGGSVRATTCVALDVRPDATVVVRCGDESRWQAHRVVLATNPGVARVLDGVDPVAVPAPPRVAPGELVAVVGGGLTAVQLVRCVVERGARAVMIARRPLVERAFDVDPGWMGPKYLAEYSRIDDPAQRLAQVRAARDGGSVPGPDLEWLRTRAGDGTVEVLEGVAAVGVEQLEPGAVVRLADGTQIHSDHVVAAIGSRYDVRSDPLLRPLVTAGRLSTLEGFPLLDPGLQVPGTGVHVTGRAATIQLGPAAGNLSGARRAARRIAASVAGVDPVAADPAVSNQPLVPSRSAPAGHAANRSWRG